MYIYVYYCNSNQKKICENIFACRITVKFHIGSRSLDVTNCIFDSLNLPVGMLLYDLNNDEQFLRCSAQSNKNIFSTFLMACLSISLLIRFVIIENQTKMIVCHFSGTFFWAHLNLAFTKDCLEEK